MSTGKTCPRQPTAEMIDAGDEAFYEREPIRVWQAMYDAAPQDDLPSDDLLRASNSRGKAMSKSKTCPREPTPEMLKAFCDAAGWEGTADDYGAANSLLLAARDIWWDAAPQDDLPSDRLRITDRDSDASAWAKEMYQDPATSPKVKAICLEAIDGREDLENWMALRAENERLRNELQFDSEAWARDVERLRQAEQDNERLRQALRHFAERGLNADLNPTMFFNGDDKEMYAAMCEYLRRLDAGVRQYASDCLADKR